MKRSNLYPREYRYIGFLGIWLLISYLLFTWNFPITDTVESNYALTALTMIHHNDYISPMIYDVYWYDKPILTYWMLIASYKLFGVSDFAARIPFAICATLNGLVMYYGVRTLFKRVRLALWSAIILGTSLEFWYISHGILTDGFLFLFSQGIFFCAYEGLRRQSVKRMVYAYIFAGLAVLTKGPVGLILPGLILLIYVVAFQHSRHNFMLLFHPIGLLAFCIVALPWYVAMYSIHGMNFIEAFLGLHNYVRATVPEHPEQNWWFMYFVLWPVSLFPWTGLTIYELVDRVRNRRSADRSHNRHSLDGGSLSSEVITGPTDEPPHWLAYALTWGLGVFIFYNLMATKYLTYTFLCLIPFIIITAQGGETLYHRLHSEVQTRRFTLDKWLLFVPLLIISISGLFGVLFGISKLPDHENYLTANGPQILTLLVLSIALIVLPLVVAYKKQNVRASFAGTAISISLFYILLLCLLPPLVGPASTKDLAKALPAEASTQIYYYRDYRTSLVYYSGHKVTQIIQPADADNLWSEGKNVMPTLTIPNAVTAISKEKDFLILVPKKYQSDFMNSGLAGHTFEWGRVGNVFIYMPK